jgi:hypothetical protein
VALTRLFFDILQREWGRENPKMNQPQKNTRSTKKKAVFCAFFAFPCGKNSNPPRLGLARSSWRRGVVASSRLPVRQSLGGGGRVEIKRSGPFWGAKLQLLQNFAGGRPPAGRAKGDA